MKSRRLFVYICFLSLWIFTNSCERDKVHIRIIEDPELLARLYQNSMDTLYIDNKNFTLHPYLYRNFMPSVIPEKRYLVASLILHEIDSILVGHNIIPGNLYIINEQKIWVSKPELMSHYFDYQLYGVSTDGPLWEPGTLVDVVLEIKYIPGDLIYLIISKNISIEKVE